MTDPTPGAGAPDAGVVLTPVQQRTMDALRRTDPPLVFAPEIVADLRHDADAALADLGARLGDTELYVTKHAIAGVLDCEAHHLAPDPFTWTPARARGQVSHKAIQLLLNWRGEPTPADLVDEALARLADEPTKLGDYVAGLGPGGAADLRGQAVERVTKFLECFPPLDRRWHPMTEASAQFPLEGPIVLRARVDLIIGRPVERESRKVIIDLKSGRIMPRHREDLRFYALVETLCRDVPPRKLATFSLDSGDGRRRGGHGRAPPFGAAAHARRDRADGRVARRGARATAHTRGFVPLVSAARRLRAGAGVTVGIHRRRR